MKRVAQTLLALLLCEGWSLATEPTKIDLWPHEPPGETKQLPPEADLSGPDAKRIAGKPVIRLGNVSTPQIAVYAPEDEVNTRTAVVICPGGGHRVLAYDLEGTEVAAWLNKLGVTAVVLKYRVPAREPERRWRAAVQDAQRAISFVRSNAQQWNIDPHRIGILGFSAGGETATRSTLAVERAYAPVDASDEVSFRADFMVLVYPAYLATKQGVLEQDIQVTPDAPPTFLVHAHNDRVTSLSSALLYVELRRAGVAAELHIYAAGGHGYGLRPQAKFPVTRWPELCTLWLQQQDLILPQITDYEGETNE